MVSLLKSIKAHNDKVWNINSHPTLPLLATASTDKTSKIFKLSSLQNFPQLTVLEDTHKRSIRAIEFKPTVKNSADPSFVDLPALALGSFDSTISIWGIDEPSNIDLIDESEISNHEVELLTNASNEWNLIAIIEGHENEIKSVSWNWSGKYLASCSRDKTIWIWETDSETLEEFECICVLNDHGQDIKHVTWHPTKNILASSSYDDTIRIYKQDVDDDDHWSTIGILNGHEGTVWCSKFENPDSPMSKENRIRLVSVSDDLTVRIWSSEDKENEEASELPSSIKHRSEELVWELDCILPTAHSYPIYSVSWSDKTGKIATCGSDGLIVIYKEVSDGNWEIENMKEASHGVYEVNSIIWANTIEGDEILITAGDDGYINFWEVQG
ncbi:unnamed protein product [Candida verbasci]|uniref:Probable cytosolic iron-sulfur protein assembly protein 1 n=1 Tax=Candida verbasci TaxID=1227364 RepID=A0A9W4U0Q2_9ASCO|nr:unnamed protein product [Candida verbasci]